MDTESLARQCASNRSEDSELWVEQETDRSFEWDGDVLKSTETSQDQGAMLRLASEDKIGSAYVNGEDVDPDQLVRDAASAREWVEADADRRLAEPRDSAGETERWSDEFFTSSPLARRQQIETAIRSVVDEDYVKSIQVSYHENQRKTELYREGVPLVSQAQTGFSFAAWAICEKNGDVETGYEHQSARFYESLALARVLETAIRRGTRQLGAQPAQRYHGPLVLDVPASSALLRLIRRMVDGESMIHGRSAWTSEKIGESVAGDNITIVDDPSRSNGPGNREFDDEGHRMEPVNVVEKGTLRNFLTNDYVANRSDIPATNRARRDYKNRPSVGHTNLVLEVDSAVSDPVEELEDGPVVTGLQTGSGLDPVAGRFSVGAKGYYVENGEPAGAFQEATLSGSIGELLKHVVVAGDTYPQGYNIAAPALLVEGLTLGGT